MKINTSSNVNLYKHKKINRKEVSPSQKISFKSGATIISAADKQLAHVFSQHYGTIAERVGYKIGKLSTESNVLKKGSRFVLEKGVSSIKDKSIGVSILENVVFPFVTLPLYGVNWVLKQMQSIPKLKDTARNIYNNPVLRTPRKLNELDLKTNIIKGIFGKTEDVVRKFAKEKGIKYDDLLELLNKTDDISKSQPLVKEANEYIKENLYKVSNKFFDKHTGNFNTAYERPLNRIVTGLIPVAFLANDAYNLSVLCGDTKNVSEKEAKERRNQEISRVFTTAYIQLLTFGAFTKQVNTLPWFTPLTSAATVLFSEISSRLKQNKPVFFLSKEKAKEYNKKYNPSISKPETPPKELTLKSNIKFPSKIEQPSIFKTFNSSFSGSNQIESKKEVEKGKKEQKALINFDTFKKGVGILITAGFALSLLKNSSLTKNSKFMQTMNRIGEFFKTKVYNKLAFKDFEISQEEFKKITDTLKDVGCTDVAKGHEFIKDKYAKVDVNGVVKMYKSKLSKSKVGDVVNSVINTLKETKQYTDDELEKIASSLRYSLKRELTAISENKFETVAKKTVEIANNKKANLTSSKMDEVGKLVQETISKNVDSSVLQVETKLKPFVDIVVQPFNFVLSAAKLPFNIVSSAIKLLTGKIEKKAIEEAIGKAELSKFERIIHKTVTQIYGEKSEKAGKISQTVFVNAMEQLQKQTMPYRNAEINLQKLKSSNASQELIKKAEDKLLKEKNKLAKYVNIAVEKSFNGVTQSSNKNTDLAMMAKLASSTVTSAFLVADNYNMVMIKSDGEDSEKAKESANERIIQRLSALFYQSLFINWFNSTFRSTYNSSLKGMASVAIPNTITTEILTRKSIGMPIGRKTYDELLKNEEKNENRTGFLGKYFKFMRLLTGKKPLSQRMPKKEIVMQSTTARTLPISSNSKLSTNLLERYSK